MTRFEWKTNLKCIKKVDDTRLTRGLLIRLATYNRRRRRRPSGSGKFATRWIVLNIGIVFAIVSMWIGSKVRMRGTIELNSLRQHTHTIGPFFVHSRNVIRDTNGPNINMNQMNWIENVNHQQSATSIWFVHGLQLNFSILRLDDWSHTNQPVCVSSHFRI